LFLDLGAGRGRDPADDAATHGADGRQERAGHEADRTGARPPPSV
jgi:hypothetical protein